MWMWQTEFTKEFKTVYWKKSLHLLYIVYLNFIFQWVPKIPPPPLKNAQNPPQKNRKSFEVLQLYTSKSGVFWFFPIFVQNWLVSWLGAELTHFLAFLFFG